MIFSISACAIGASTVNTIVGKYVPCVFQMDQCPHLGIATNNHMSAPSAIAAIGSAFRYKLFPAEMYRSGATITGATEYLYIIYKIGIGHIIYLTMHN
jgi:hypothetical protein